MSIEFLLTSLVVVLVPGTGVIYTVSTGLFQGRRASIAAAAGCTAGIVPHLLVSILGLTTILHISALAFQIIKFAGVAYLLMLAWSMWRETGQLGFENSDCNRNLRQIALRAVLINILNPKLSIFFLAFLPQFISSGTGSSLAQLCSLSLIFMGMTFLVFVLYGLFAHTVRTSVIGSPRMIRRLQRTFALAFAALGLKLATSDT